MRKVTLKLTTQKDLIVVETNARTFGELKKELKNVKWDGMRVVERSTKNTLEMDEAILPATDFVLFLVPEKVKAGRFDSKSASYNELRSHLAFLNKMKDAKLSLDGKVDELRERVIKYYSEDNVAEEVETADPILIIEGCREKINDAIDLIIENINKGVCQEDTEEYIIKLTASDLDTEVNEIKRVLKL